MAEPNSGLLFASPDRHPTFAPVSLGASARPTVAASRPTLWAPSGVAKVATFIKKGSCSDASSAIEERTLPDPDSTLYGQTVEERLNECLANKFGACTRFVSPAEKGVISCPSGRTINLQCGHEWVDANACFAPCPKGLVWHGPESLEGACVKDCPEGTGRDELNIKCLPCATSCGGSCWLGDAEWACGDKCNDSLPLVKGGLLKRTEHTCVASCPSGTYQVNEECVADHRDVDGAYNNQCTGPNYWTKHPPDICNDGLSCNTLVDAGSVRKEKCCFSQSDKGKGENCAYDFGEIPEGYRASTNHACVLPKPLENGRCFQDPTTWIVDAGNAAKVPWIGFTTDEGWPAGAENVFKQLSLFVAQTDDIREKYNNLRSARSWQSTLKGEPSKNYVQASCNETCVDNVKAQLNAELDILTTANDWAETIDKVAESHANAALWQTESVDELLKVENYQVTLAGTDSQTSYVTEMVSSAASFGLSKVPGGDVISLMTSTVGLFLGQETDPDPEIVAFPSTNSELTMAYDEYHDMVGSNVVGKMALTQLENVASRDWGSLATFGMLAKGMTQPLWSDTVSAGWDDEATCTTYTGVYKYWCAKDVYWQNALKALMPAKYKLCTTRVECYYRCERSCDCTTRQRAMQEGCYDYNGEQSPKHDPHHTMFEQWHAMFYDTRDGIEMNYRYTATFGYLCSGDSTDNRLDDTWIEHAWKHGYLEEFHHPRAGGAVADFLRATYSSNVDGSYFNCGDCKYDDQDSYTNAVMSAEPMAVNGLQLRKLPWQHDNSDNNGMLQVGNSMDWTRSDDKFTYDNPWLEEAPCCCGHSDKCYGTVPCGDQTHGFLMIRVVSGRDVRGKGNNCEGKRDRDCLETDPYVKVSTKDYGLLNCGYGFKCDQTDYKDDTDKPVWNKEMNFGVQQIGTTIRVELWDDDPGDDDFMGRTTFSVPGKTGVFELFVEGEEGKGHIKLNVTFDLPGNN